MKKPVALASDHGGYELKQQIKSRLKQDGIEWIDFGNDSFESCDYADYAEKACRAIQNETCDFALLFCGTGVGMSMAANKMAGIRAYCCSDSFSARMTRRHNNANVLCLGGRVVGAGLAEALIELFLDTPFEGGRHQLRIDKIAKLENAR